jgi:hypothetical protein
MQAPTTAQVVPTSPPLFDETRLAVSGFLARYSGTTRVGYATDLRAWFSWCVEAKLEIFGVRRAHIELFARWMEEERHLARATIGCRRWSASTGSRSSTTTSPRRPPSMSAVRRSTPSRPPSVSTA